MAITGCEDAVVGPIIRGAYTLQSENHDRPVYRKDEKVGVKGLDVVLYFWDDRESPDFSGWWFGPQVGGDEVWAFHPDKAAKNPPSEGWQCPFDGPVDATIKLAPSKVVASSGGVGAPIQPGLIAGSKPLGALPVGPTVAAKAAVPLTGAAAKQDEARRKREQEVARKAEETSRKAEGVREKEAEVRKIQQAAQKKKEAEKKGRERHSLLMLRRVMARLRLCKPENYQALMIELGNVVVAEKMNLPPQFHIEVDKVKADAQKRVNTITECIKQATERKKIAEEQRKERVEEAKKHLDELEKLVQVAEVSAQSLFRLAEDKLPISETPTAEQVEAFEEEAKKIDEETTAKYKVCLDYVAEHREKMEQVSDNKRIGKRSVDVLANRAEASNRTRIGAMANVDHAKRLAFERQEQARVAAERKAAAEELVERERAVFKRYDKDGDGLLKKVEAKSYAKGEFGCEVSDDAIELLLHRLSEESGKDTVGVPFESFRDLKVAVGVSREVVRDRERQSVKKERLATMEYQVSEIEALLTTAEASVQSAKVESEKLHHDEKRSSADLKSLCAEVSSLVAAAETKLSAALARVEELSKGDSTGILEEHRIAHTKLFTRATGEPKAALQKVKTTVETCEKQIKAREAEEVKQFSAKAASILRKCSPKAQGDGEDFLEGFGSDLEGAPISKEAIFGILRDKWEDPKPSDELFQKWFESLAEPESDSLPPSEIWRIIRVCYRVLRPSVLSEGLSSKDSTVLRRLDPEEVLELIGSSESQKDNVGLERVHIRALKDGKTGWVSLKSNTGISFIQLGGDCYTVIKETGLSESIQVAGPNAKDPFRFLKLGEVLDIIGPEKTDEASNLIRVKVRTQSDRAVGWVTRLGNKGTIFMRPS
eukprot:TRINITY_DN26757_c0_g1_i1.p1 TRINITY_DN26757_c0_g1~~TRINITY_DN26757_c0_g1_i1.p1  ORF type:complete len:946 (+),score=231.26 TRINITY_DN26757_c0_g1_i1:190-2838(+)